MKAEELLPLLVEPQTADTLRRRVRIGHESVYTALVHLEARGLVSVWPSRQLPRRWELTAAGEDRVRKLESRA